MKRYQVVHAPTKDRFSEGVTYRDTDDRQDAVQGFVIAAARWDGYVALVTDGKIEKERLVRPDAGQTGEKASCFQ